MKKLTLLTILFFLVFINFSFYATAQDRVSACITSDGNIVFNVEKTNFQVCISQEGKLVSYTLLSNGSISYNFRSRIESIGHVSISYDFKDRIDKIDIESFSYDFEGRINQIGSTKIIYNVQNKVENIGGRKISYNIQGKVANIE